MKRLTNLQMQVLSKEVTNQLKKAHEQKMQSITNSEEYINFDKTYTDDILKTLRIAYTNLKDKENLRKKLSDEMDTIGEDLEKFIQGYNEDRDLKRTLAAYSYSTPHRIESVIQNYIDYKKGLIFKEVHFNEEEMLNTVQASILLSEVGDPKTLVNELVDKFTNG